MTMIMHETGGIQGNSGRQQGLGVRRVFFQDM